MTVIKIWVLLNMFVLALSFGLPARSQPAQESIPVPLTAQERGVVLGMCDQAVYAARRQFEGACDYFKTKFETAERDAKAKADAKPAEPEKKD